MQSEQILFRVLIIVFTLWILGPILWKRIKKRDFNYKHLLLLLAGFFLIVLLVMVNITANGTCANKTREEFLVGDIKETYCKAQCYCDGLSVGNSCLGVWRYVCPQ